MELIEDKRLMNELGGIHLSSKVTAIGSEVRGIYYIGENSNDGYKKGNDITIKKMDVKGFSKKIVMSC